MKKLLSAVSIFLCIVMLSASVYAVNVGDIVNHTLHTDIVAYIDGQPIESYNISGYTAIMAEQLMGYGFNVVWNQSSRALYINEGDGRYTIFVERDGAERELDVVSESGRTDYKTDERVSIVRYDQTRYYIE